MFFFVLYFKLQPPDLYEFILGLAKTKCNSPKFKEAAEALKNEGLDFLTFIDVDFQDLRHLNLPTWCLKEIKKQGRHVWNIQ